MAKRQEPVILSTVTTIDVDGNPVVTVFTVGDERAASTSSQDGQGGANTGAVDRYLATLSNDDVVTVTRAAKPYVTTFRDGETSTICDVSNRCLISTGSSTKTSYTSSGRVIIKTQKETVTVTTGASQETGSGSDGHRELSKGDVAGIVIAIVGALIIAGLALFFIRRRRKRGNSSDVAAAGQEYHGEVLERHEKDGAIISELHERALPSEADDSMRHELEAPKPELQGDVLAHRTQRPNE